MPTDGEGADGFPFPAGKIQGKGRSRLTVTVGDLDSIGHTEPERVKCWNRLANIPATHSPHQEHYTKYPMASFDLIEQLESQLLEKEQLIAALTTSLEQAANELDRAHRQTPQGPYLSRKEEEDDDPDDPNDALLREIRDQQAMLLEIREGVRYLNNVPPQPAYVAPESPDPALLHIEEKLEQIRELIESLAQSQPEAAVLPADWKESLTQQMSKLRDNPIADLIGLSLNPSDDVSKGVKAQDVPEEDLPAVKEPKATESASARPSPLIEPPDSIPGSTESREERTARLIETLPEIPAGIDLESADEETLRLAVAERDDCIQAMQDYIVALNTTAVPKFDLNDYDSLPPAQREQLENWEAVLRENLRRTEVEISVERAKLAREQQKLQFQQLQMAKERKRLGVQQSLSPASEPELKKPGQRGGQSSRTWLNLFHRQDATAEEDQGDSGSGN